MNWNKGSRQIEQEKAVFGREAMCKILYYLESTGSSMLDRFECRLSSGKVEDESSVRSVIRSLCDDATQCSDVSFSEVEYALQGVAADEPEQDSILLRHTRVTACDSSGISMVGEPVSQCEMCYQAAADSSLHQQRNPLHKKHHCKLPVAARRSLGSSAGSNAPVFVEALGFAPKLGYGRDCHGTRWVSRGGLTVQLITESAAASGGGTWKVEIFNTCAPSEIERGLRQVEQFALLLDPFALFSTPLE